MSLTVILELINKLFMILGWVKETSDRNRQVQHEKEVERNVNEISKDPVDWFNDRYGRVEPKPDQLQNSSNESSTGEARDSADHQADSGSSSE